jgi:hypothetical protein
MKMIFQWPLPGVLSQLTKTIVPPSCVSTKKVKTSLLILGSLILLLEGLSQGLILRQLLISTSKSLRGHYLHSPRESPPNNRTLNTLRADSGHVKTSVLERETARVCARARQKCPRDEIIPFD